MLFRKEIEPRCAYCAKGAQAEEDQVVCIKRGIVSPSYHCRSFQYDPLRRTPPPPAPPRKRPFSPEDFSLDVTP
ncbi:MAG: hypothetical protein PHY23_04520 [Oscillospiraceae bacterium]|jgi:hypothetical protein|nr:hypothetical protein [Oscillospiraceae bacterium]